MKYFVILFLFLSIISKAQQITIEGKIFNNSSKQPLPSANIIVINKNIGTSSAEDGSFFLKGNFDKKDIVRISYLGFETKEYSVEHILELNSVNIYLEQKLITSQTILVSGSIAKTGETPIAYSKIDRNNISKTYTDQDIPEVLSYMPSATFYSENGNGLGYNYLSIRGFDQKRISVAVNGIPQNDPEDHNVYWIDFPDLLEGTELIQVQRGAGSGIAGFAAIGGSINIITSSFSDKLQSNISTSMGSSNTRKYSASVSTGLIDNKYSFYAKLSQTLSSGYRNSSWVNLQSYHLSAIRYDDHLTSQINLYGGPIKDGLAYTGLPKFAVKDESLRKGNYSYWEADNNKYTYTLERRPQEIENFFQPHFELLNEFKIDSKVTFNSALFLVIGNGFFDYDASWADTSYFRLTNKNGFNAKQNPENAIIRAEVDNTQWGWIPRVSFKHTDGELIVGGELRIHRSKHWGAISYAEYLPSEWNKDYKYYYYEGANNIMNFYAHENYNIKNNFNILAEVQFAYHKYQIKNERYLNNNFSIDNLFFNPRLGLNYRFNNELNIYLSYSKVSREPRLKNYYDAAESSGGSTPQFEQNITGTYDFSNPFVKPETMHDIELGTSFNNNFISSSINAFYMIFNDEIVKQGQLDRFGQPITGNMNKTIHYGVELTMNSIVSNNFEFLMNASFSKNYISDGSVYFSNEDPLPVLYKFDLSGNKISGFPSAIFNAVLKYNYDDLLVQISEKYVGSYYSDNYDAKLNDYLKIYPGIAYYNDNKVDPYFKTDLFMSYSMESNLILKQIKFFFKVNNLFNELYAANAVGAEYFPAAGRNYLMGLKLTL